MDNFSYLYDDNIVTAINTEMSFSTNVLEKYDNVVYHCALFAFDHDDEQKIEENLAMNGTFTGEESKRVYIVRDGVTTKFSISNFTMKNTFGNIGSELNIATYSIKLKITEAMSCLLTNELETLAFITGYEGYLMRPYWFEIWFSGYDSETLMPISKIPLPNGEKSLLFKGFLSNVKSHLDSSGTEWSVDFTPSYDSILSKNSNILSTSFTFNSNKQGNLKDFLTAASNTMFEKFKEQFGSGDEEKKAIENKYSGQKYITINLKDENGNDWTEEIKYENDSSTNQAESNAEQHSSDKRNYFTTIVQDFLQGSEKHKSYIAKYDIKSSFLDYYNNKPLYKHNVDIYLLKDEYMDSAIEAYDKNKTNNFNAYNFFDKLRKNNSLVKKYQFGYSGVDSSVLEVFNNYDNLYFMNALPQAADENMLGNAQFRYEKDTNLRNTNNNIITTGLASGYLEDIYKDLYEYLKGDMSQVSGFSKMPFINSNVQTQKRESTTSNYIKDKKTVASKVMWENLYKSGQMSETKFTILGDPYWIATNAYKSSQNGSSNNLLDSLLMNSPNVPDYRCVFIIRSTPDQNDAYTETNPTDYSFEYSLHASGIYLMVECESIFEDGKFIQKLRGVIDPRFIKDNGNKHVNSSSSTK